MSKIKINKDCIHYTIGKHRYLQYNKCIKWDTKTHYRLWHEGCAGCEDYIPVEGKGKKDKEQSNAK